MKKNLFKGILLILIVLISLNFVSASQELLSYWKFEKNLGDSIGASTGIGKGNIEYASGKIGKALSLKDSYVEIQDNKTFNFNEKDFTISLWLKTSQQDSQMRLINKRSGKREITGYDIYLKKGDTGLGWFIGDGSLYIDSDNSKDADKNRKNLRDGKWHHIAVVFDRTNKKVSSYVDGNLEITKDISSIGNIDNNISLKIGRYGDYDINYFTGEIDELKIWNFALSSEQVKKDYNLKAAVISPSSRSKNYDNEEESKYIAELIEQTSQTNNLQTQEILENNNLKLNTETSSKQTDYYTTLNFILLIAIAIVLILILFLLILKRR